MRVGVASHPGRPSTAHVEIKSNRDVTPRLQLDRVIQVDDDCGVSRPQVHGKARRMVSSDVLVVAGGTRFAVLTESDGESVEPLVRPTGQRRSQDDVNTIPASSGAAAAHLISVGGGVQWEGHISPQPLPTCRDDNSSDDENVWARVGESHLHPTEVDVQDTVISTVGDVQGFRCAGGC